MSISFMESMISCNINGVMSEIGKYPLAKILTALTYIHNCEINSLYIYIYVLVFYCPQI